jgi:hypothetical protein
VKTVVVKVIGAVIVEKTVAECLIAVKINNVEMLLACVGVIVIMLSVNA